MLNSTQNSAITVLDQIENDITRIGDASDRWQFIKFKNNGNIKVKGTEHSLFRLVETTQRITSNLTTSQEDEIAGEWSRVVNADSVTLSEVGSNSGNVKNAQTFELPRDGIGRDKPSMKSSSYIRASILNAFYYKWDIAGDSVNTGTRANVRELAEDIDNTRSATANEFQLLSSQFDDITNAIATSDTVEQFQEILNTLNAIDNAYIEFNNSVDDVNDFIFTLNSNTKAYINNVYESIQLLRKRIYNNVGNSNKFAIKWPATVIAIIEKYSPGKTYTNYQKS